MRNFPFNHYEQAFKNWLIDNHIQYVAVDESKRASLGHSKIKSLDFLLYPPGRQIIIAEVKGRKFRGVSFAKLTGLECWVTIDDIDGLTGWQRVFGHNHIAAFIFVYRMENIDVDFDGRDVFDFEMNKYIFFAITLDDYQKFMKPRSHKWQTVTLPAERFRQCAVPISEFLMEQY